MTCAICKKPLRDKRSILRGVGPTCARHEAKAPYLLPDAAPKPEYADVLLLRGADGLLHAYPGMLL